MIPAVLAALAMVANDICGTIMVMAEAAERGWLAGIMDAVGWGVAITTTTISVSTLQGHDLDRKILVCGLVTLANVFGTKSGQLIGSRLIRSKRFRKGPSFEERLLALEMAAHK